MSYIFGRNWARKSPLNMFRRLGLTPARSRKSWGADAATALQAVFFLIFIKGWSGLKPR
jgi:hypothetical protein